MSKGEDRHVSPSPEDAADACAMFLRNGCKVSYYCWHERDAAEFMAAFAARHPELVEVWNEIKIEVLEHEEEKEEKYPELFIVDEMLAESEDENNGEEDE